jgi:hypothetical protein
MLDKSYDPAAGETMTRMDDQSRGPEIPPPPRPDLVGEPKPGSLPPASPDPGGESAHLLNEAKWNGTVLGGLAGIAMSLAIGAAHYIFVTHRMAAAGSASFTLGVALLLVPAGVYFGLQAALRLQRRKREDRFR